jgi:hypothetical protein
MGEIFKYNLRNKSNVLKKLFMSYPNMLWDKFILSSNPNIDIKFAADHINKELSALCCYQGFSENFVIAYQFEEKYIDFLIKDGCGEMFTLNFNIKKELVDKYPALVRNSVLCNHNTYYRLRQILDEKSEDYNCITICNDFSVDMEYIEGYLRRLSNKIPRLYEDYKEMEITTEILGNINSWDRIYCPFRTVEIIKNTLEIHGIGET